MTAEPVVGVGRNPVNPRVADALAGAARRLGVAVREIDLPTLRARLDVPAAPEVADASGPVVVTHLAPCLLYWQPAAAVALGALEQAGVRAANPVPAAATADDKAAAAVVLARAGVAQVPTWVVPQDAALVRAQAEQVGLPVVLKRTHGAQGRWVRVAYDPAQLADACAELAAEGPGPLVLQPLVAEARGRSVRAIVAGGPVVAATERRATGDEWRSNIARGGTQRRVELTDREEVLAREAARALGLGLAGVDLLRTASGPVVLEVNACPDFTSMRDHVEADIAAAVVDATLRA